MKKTRASGRNVSKVFNPVVKLVLESQPFPTAAPVEFCVAIVWKCKKMCQTIILTTAFIHEIL